MFRAIDMATSGLVAQRIRMDVAAMNGAQADTVYDPAEGGPYQRRSVILAAGRDAHDRNGGGVRVAAIAKEPTYRYQYEPENPYADAHGMVKLPGIEPMVEMVNLMEASRAYEANVTAIEVSKAMLNASLRLLA
jgi:flagellar basal-body rod protein FlgC